MDAPGSLPSGSREVFVAVFKVWVQERISGGITMEQILRMDIQGIVTVTL